MGAKITWHRRLYFEFDLGNEFVQEEVGGAVVHASRMLRKWALKAWMAHSAALTC